MKKFRWLLLSTICTAVLLTLCAVFYLREDHIAPQIQFEDTGIVYREGMEESLLLEGVRAVDERDGDVSDTVCVDQIIAFPEEGAVIVTYVAKDDSNNVAKENRWVEMEEE